MLEIPDIQEVKTGKIVVQGQPEKCYQDPISSNKLGAIVCTCSPK
jgi:hypothetical protein